MANPFTTRATEHFKSNEAFLTIVTPDPIACFLEPYAADDGLFRRLFALQGPPGSGKTTIARLFEFSTLATLMRNGENEIFSELVGPLQKCGAVKDGLTRVLGCRIPLESDYQELWQLPYAERIRTELLHRLIQARAVLAWLSQLLKAGVAADQVSLEAKEETHAPLAYVGGSGGPDILNRAKEVEAAIYRVIGALIPPGEAEIESELVEPYRPFDIIEAFRIAAGAAQLTLTAERVQPLVILDDANCLHPPQFAALKTWLMRRELRIGRWILSRLDALQPKELFDSLSEEEGEFTLPGVTAGRDIIRVNLQSAKRREGRVNFRTMTRQMSRKYLRRMRIFEQNGITALEGLLPERIDPISRSDLKHLTEAVQSRARRLKVSEQRVSEFAAMADEFLVKRDEHAEDLKWAMVRILLHRYAKRTPQTSLFTDIEDPEPNKPLRVDLSVYDGARMHLYHEFKRPYYVGFDTLSDAASENAETFLQLASCVVEASENQLIKQRPGAIPAREQQRLLVQRANGIIDDWSFPEHRRVRTIADWIAQRCLARTREDNAPLGHGANAYGIPHDEFESLGSNHPALAKVLKFAVAYNAVTLVPNYDCKKRLWCLLELGGVFIVRVGLPFKRGGFIEGNAGELVRVIEESK